MQKPVSLSTAEAEYYSESASEMAIEVLYLRNLLANMGFVQAPDTPVTVYEDNAACIEWGNLVIGGRERAKHIDIRKHFARKTIQNRQMRLIKEPSEGCPTQARRQGIGYDYAHRVQGGQRSIQKAQGAAVCPRRPTGLGRESALSTGRAVCSGDESIRSASIRSDSG